MVLFDNIVDVTTADLNLCVVRRVAALDRCGVGATLVDGNLRRSRWQHVVTSDNLISSSHHSTKPEQVHGVNPQAYFTDLLTRLVYDWPQKCIDELMPWLWVPQQPP